MAGFGRRFQTANAVALTPAGRIVIAGSTSNGITSRSAVARFLRDGRLDDTFGDDGRVTTDVSPSGEQLTERLGEQPDGKIVAVGWAEGSLVPAFLVVRYTGDGRLDDGFDRDGVAKLDVSVGSDKGLGAALQTDGSLVIVDRPPLTVEMNGDRSVGPHGHLDDTFGHRGLLVTSFGPGYDEAAAVSAQGNGKLVVVGRIRKGAKDDMGLLRLKPGGLHDLTFGAGGRVLCDFAGQGLTPPTT